MAVLRRSLAQDSVVYYTLTISVPFFILLSLVTWLLPLNQSEPVLSYKAQCWCPVEFTHEMVEYTNAVCGAVFNLRIQGIDPGTRNVDASLYDIPSSDLMPVTSDDMKEKEFMPIKESSEFLQLNRRRLTKRGISSMSRHHLCYSCLPSASQFLIWFGHSCLG
ncbi:pannexin 7 [Plakobranchus ocellatus]|uniref:Pannexin 7 n=1 Tax=Plakobranchus ocellatus TaxID=259542 RepID=A0AAV3YBY6_9GAST|nr:pannexin 7 [Plakobranchus ocellatus]